MKTTVTESLEMAETGDWDRAWEIAQLDEGMIPTATQGWWVAWAQKAIARRASAATQERAHFLISD